jgi:hypothetical protein
VPTVTGLTDETVTEGETVPGETFRLGGQGPFTVSVETTNAALLPPAYASREKVVIRPPENREQATCVPPEGVGQRHRTTKDSPLR